MILRSLRSHVESHNRFAAAIDIIVLVIGVFLGVQVSNWNQAGSTAIGAMSTACG